jgi:putative membrane protein insertion efficiency factor
MIRRIRTKGPQGSGGQNDSACDGIDLPGCDSCDGCDLPCDIFGLVAFGSLALATPSRAPRRRPTAPARLGVTAIRGYQRWISPRLDVTCRHEPSCSQYGVGAVARYGLVTGSRLTAGRLSRCTRDTPHGTVDPVP